MDKKAIYSAGSGLGLGVGTNFITGNAGLAIMGVGFPIGLPAFAAGGAVVGLAFYGLYRAVKKKKKSN